MSSKGNATELLLRRRAVISGQVDAWVLEYLENGTRSSTSNFADYNWFDTGYIFNTNSDIEFVMQNTKEPAYYSSSSESYYHPRGGMTGDLRAYVDGNFVIGAFSISSNSFRFYNRIYNNQGSSLSLYGNFMDDSLYEKHFIRLSPYEGLAQIDDTINTTNFAGIEFTPLEISMPLFRFFRSDEYYFEGRLYYAHFRDSGISVRYFLPVERNGVAMLYDEVNKQYYENQYAANTLIKGTRIGYIKNGLSYNMNGTKMETI